jgi:hypothetical protein
MANKNEYDPNNPAHKALADKIVANRDNLSDAEKRDLAAAMNSGDLGKANKIIGPKK